MEDQIGDEIRPGGLQRGGSIRTIKEVLKRSPSQQSIKDLSDDAKDPVVFEAACVHKDINDRTVLHWACQSKHLSVDTVRLLAAVGCGDLDAEDDAGMTPVELALSAVQANAAVNALFLAGADPFHVDRGGRSYIDFCQSRASKNDTISDPKSLMKTIKRHRRRAEAGSQNGSVQGETDQADEEFNTTEVKKSGIAAPVAETPAIRPPLKGRRRPDAPTVDFTPTKLEDSTLPSEPQSHLLGRDRTFMDVFFCRLCIA